MKRQKNGIWKLSDEEMVTIACLAGAASRQYIRDDCNALAREAENISFEIYNILNSIGYFKGVQNEETN